MLEVGAKMPEFSLRDPEREEITHETLAGSISVLAFYPMAFTGG